jgi:archaeosine-15-forming tRNA-guanine transglycosylase
MLPDCFNKYKVFSAVGRGAGELLPDNLVVKKSRNTKRIRWLYEGNEMVASVRAGDHFIIPH